jgi:hypothetical protein
MRRKMMLISLLAIGLLVSPGSAFTAEMLRIDVMKDGDANITFDYSLSWLETIGVFLQIARPDAELKTALEQMSGKSATVVSVGSRSAVFSVAAFSGIQESAQEAIYTTPALDFTRTEDRLAHYWFAPLIQADFSPAMTVVRFPDGYEETFPDRSAIPGITHAIPLG